jgi:hypothetical protein
MDAEDFLHQQDHREILAHGGLRPIGRHHAIRRRHADLAGQKAVVTKARKAIAALRKKGYTV